jgi:hypothetical protein
METDWNPREDPKGGEFLNARVVASADISDTGLLPKVQAVERGDERVELSSSASAAVSWRDGVLMGAEAGMTEEGADRLGDPSGEQVLKFTGVGFTLLNRHPQDIDDQTLRQSMAADDLFRRAPPLTRKVKIAKGCPRQKAGRFSLPEEIGGHLGHRASGNALFGGHPLLFGRPDRLQQLDDLISQSCMGCHQ